MTTHFYYTLYIYLFSSRISEKELHAICTDLVLNHFICPAIVNPEAHGVVEVPVSYIARFNLIQIAQIVQMLCLARFQEVSLDKAIV